MKSNTDSKNQDSILWPILHYQSGVVFDSDAWKAYQKVNELFADAILREVPKGSLIWVHDYHLMLLPKLLREGLNNKGTQCALGFSLHTPFPACDFWRALPVGDELIEGMLASDLIGFHTDVYRQNFMGASVNLLYVFSCKHLSAEIALSNSIIGVLRHRLQTQFTTKIVQSRRAHSLLESIRINSTEHYRSPRSRIELTSWRSGMKESRSSSVSIAWIIRKD